MRPSDIAQVVTVMNQMRADVNIDQPLWNDVPVAVTIAKSDKLMGCDGIPADSLLFDNTKENGQNFNREENMSINKFLSEYLGARANSTVAPLNSFRLRRTVANYVDSFPILKR